MVEVDGGEGFWTFLDWTGLPFVPLTARSAECCTLAQLFEALHV